MATRTKTGGRTKGTPNKKTDYTKKLLEDLDCDPIEGMALIARQAMKANDYELAGRMYKELAQYVAPKIKSQEPARSDQDSTIERIEIEFV